MVRIAADMQEIEELQRQLQADKTMHSESEEMNDEALASLEETIQALELEKDELKEEAERGEEMIAKMRQDIEGLRSASARAAAAAKVAVRAKSNIKVAPIVTGGGAGETVSVLSLRKNFKTLFGNKQQASSSAGGAGEHHRAAFL